MLKFIYFMILISLLPRLSLAKTQPVQLPENTSSYFKILGYVDASYNYLQNSNKFISGTYNRVFDTNPNGVTLQQAGITLAYQPPQGFGVLITPVEGRDSIIFAPYGWFSNNTSQTFGIAIPQAFLQYTSGSLTWMGGNFIELAGAENMFPYNNTNFSRSIIWGYAEPFTVTGLRTSYNPHDKLTLIGGINNGWDSIRDTGRKKTIELGATYKFNPMFSFAAFAYSGQERIVDGTSSGPTGQRTLIDLVATLHASDKLSFIANYDGGVQSKAGLPTGVVSKAVWQGVAGYINYKFNDRWRTSLRGELFNDCDGYRTGVVQHWDEITLTLGYALFKEVELRAETRHDFSNVASFVKKNGGTTNNQQSYALEIVSKLL
ncbi:MAG TPA: outer membrane beta-barrel protein [Legionella sp.]|nr:outer membrane beta-barrel protein [Legionella sp.]